MNKKILIKILVVLGTILVWLPILSPVFFSCIAFFSRGRFLFDYLMPAELFPLVFIGGALLLLSAVLKRAYIRFIGLSFVIGIGALFLGQFFAVITGLASGRIEPGGWQWLLVIFSLIIYIVSVISMGIGGLFLLKYLFKTSSSNPKKE